MSVKIKIATFNLRCNVKADEINMFDIRKGRILDKIDEEMPDIIGFQEMTPPMRKFLAEHLPKYHIVGRSRSADYTGEHVDIAYRKDVIEIYGLDFFWLSPTPYIPGSRYDEQSSCPRITTSGIFKHRDSNMPFRVYNTHLDHVGEKARVLGMTQILNKIKADSEQVKLPLFITGDFNAEPNSETIQLCSSFEDIPLKDLTSEIPATFHNWGKTAVKIDYIYADAETAEKGYNVNVWSGESFGVYLSDHNPICAEVTI